MVGMDRHTVEPEGVAERPHPAAEVLVGGEQQKLRMTHADRRDGAVEPIEDVGADRPIVVGDAHRHMFTQPGGTLVPMESHLAAEAAGGATLEERRQRCGLGRIARFEQGRHVVHRDPGVDTGTHAAEREPGARHDAGQSQTEVAIPGRPIRAHDAIHPASLPVRRTSLSTNGRL